MKPFPVRLNEKKLSLGEDQVPQQISPATFIEKLNESLGEFLRGYGNEPILRALIQLHVPLGGPTDFLLAWKASNSYQRRVQELLESLVLSVSHLEACTVNKEFLYSEEFFELFGTCVEVVARTASENKRKYVAAFLVGTVKTGETHDLSQQIVEDLRVLQDFHLQMLASLPESLVPDSLASENERTTHRVIDLHKLRRNCGHGLGSFQ